MFLLLFVEHHVHHYVRRRLKLRKELDAEAKAASKAAAPAAPAAEEDDLDEEDKVLLEMAELKEKTDKQRYACTTHTSHCLVLHTSYCMHCVQRTGYQEKGAAKASRAQAQGAHAGSAAGAVRGYRRRRHGRGLILPGHHQGTWSIPCTH